MTRVSQGMVVITDSDQVKARRQEKLMEILSGHPHACLTCAEREGCPRTQCSLNVPEDERCCPQLRNCELQKVAEYVGIDPSTPKWVSTDLPVLDKDPLLTRNYDLCISCTRCVRACRDLRGIESIGFVFDQGVRVTVGSVAPTLKDSGCKFYTACVEVCPTGAIIHAVAAGRKAASSIDVFLGGNGDIDESLVELPHLNPWLGREEKFACTPKLGTRNLDVHERTAL